MRLKKKFFSIILSIPILGPILYFFQSKYIGGDQAAYWIFYDYVSDEPLNKVSYFGYYWLGAIEPIHLYVMWIGSRLNIDKNLYVTIYNLLFVFGLFLFLQKNKVKVLPQILIYGNFYVSVLLFAAERLKFAYILIFYSQLVPIGLSNFLLLISPLAHLQSTLILILAYIGTLTEDLKKFFTRLTLRRRFLGEGAFFFGLLSILIFFTINTLIFKIGGYISMGLFSLNDFINFFGLYIVTFNLIKEKFKFSLMYLPLIVPLILLGGFRINMISFTISSFFIIKENKSSNLLYLSILSYFFYKNFIFLDQVINTGTGF
tara:strand:+ start:69 stop:1019 length:951 start_codon:yes stop_codon:yes gene_type:complete